MASRRGFTGSRRRPAGSIRPSRCLTVRGWPASTRSQREQENSGRPPLLARTPQQIGHEALFVIQLAEAPYAAAAVFPVVSLFGVLFRAPPGRTIEDGYQPSKQGSLTPARWRSCTITACSTTSTPRVLAPPIRPPRGARSRYEP